MQNNMLTLTNQKTQEQRQDEWMLLCQHSQQLNQNVDWEEAARQLPQPLLLSCPNWIKHTKVATDGSTTRPQCTPVDKLFEWTTNECISDCVHTLYWNDQQQLQMLILGTAFLIQAISQLLQNKCLLTATTGIAAFNIGGITFQSILHLPVQKHNCNDLRGQALAMLQHKTNGYKILDCR